MIAHVLSLLGATLVLVAYAANQMGRMDSKGIPYLALNLGGGAILTFFAVRARDPGLMLMEGSWVAISLAGIVTGLLHRARRSKASNL